MQILQRQPETAISRRARGTSSMNRPMRKSPNEQLDVALTRTYNSMATSKSGFGYGWTHSYDIELLKLGKDNSLEDGILVLPRWKRNPSSVQNRWGHLHLQPGQTRESEKKKTRPRPSP